VATLPTVGVADARSENTRFSQPGLFVAMGAGSGKVV